VRARHVEASPLSLSQAFILLFTLAHTNHKMQIFTILFVCKLPGAGTLNPVTQTPHFLCCRNSNRKYRRHINENALGIIRSTLNSGGFGPQAPNMNKELGIPSNAGPMNQLAAGYQRPLSHPGLLVLIAGQLLTDSKHKALKSWPPLVPTATTTHVLSIH